MNNTESIFLVYITKERKRVKRQKDKRKREREKKQGKRR